MVRWRNVMRGSPDARGRSTFDLSDQDGCEGDPSEERFNMTDHLILSISNASGFAMPPSRNVSVRPLRPTTPDQASWPRNIALQATHHYITTIILITG